jgi:hypothetical protein
MSASEWAAVIAIQVCLVVFVVLVVVIVRLDRAARDLRSSAASFRAEAGPLLGELRDVVRSADYELDRVDAIVTGAERVSGRVDAASDLAYRTFTNPVVKAIAAGAGTRRAVQRLTGDHSTRTKRKGRVPRDRQAS